MDVLWIVSGVIVALTTVEGVRQGVVRRAVELVGLIAVFLFASRLADLLAPQLASLFGMGSSTAFYVSWAVVLVGGVVAVRLAASGMRKLVHLTLVGWLDRVGGGVLGLAFGLVLASCGFILAWTIPVSEELREEIEASEPGNMLLHLAPAVYDAGVELIGGERFFDMLQEHLQPAAERLRDQLAETAGPDSDVRS
jgi:membrane protein required for colicin V production